MELLSGAVSNTEIMQNAGNNISIGYDGFGFTRVEETMQMVASMPHHSPLPTFQIAD
jgi:hypothetical protein